MADKLYIFENTIVLTQSSKVYDFPISDSYFTNIGTSFIINTALSKKFATILVSDISAGRYENDLGVVYTETSLNEFLRKYASLSQIAQTDSSEYVTRIFVDFSVTPLNSSNSWSMSIPTTIPKSNVIHKMVTVGDLVIDPAGDNLQFGLDSQLDYFITSPPTINASSGDVSVGNSYRTLLDNENLNIEYLGGSGNLNSGTIRITIFHA